MDTGLHTVYMGGSLLADLESEILHDFKGDHERQPTTKHYVGNLEQRIHFDPFGLGSWCEEVNSPGARLEKLN